MGLGFNYGFKGFCFGFWPQTAACSLCIQVAQPKS